MVDFDPYLSSRPLVRVLESLRPATLIIDHHYYRFSSGVFFYTDRTALLLNGRFFNMVYGSYAPGSADVFIDNGQFLNLWGSPKRYYLFVSERTMDQVTSLVPKEDLNVVDVSGGKTLFTNHPIKPEIVDRQGPVNTIGASAATRRDGANSSRFSLSPAQKTPGIRHSSPNLEKFGSRRRRPNSVNRP